MKTYIWSLPTRLFHWLLVLSLIVAYSTSGEENLLTVHSSAGYFALVLIIFRIIWGIIGPHYSRFNHFKLSPVEFFKFITNYKNYHTPGHNPGASLVMLAIIFTVLFLTFSGIAILASEGNSFSFLPITGNKEMFEELHEIFFNLLIFLFCLHIAGITIDTIIKPHDNTLFSIFSGYKNIHGEKVELNVLQKIITFVFILIAFISLISGITLQSFQTENKPDTEQHSEHNDANED